MSTLTDKDIKALQPKDHHYRVALGDGLFLWVSSSGKKIMAVQVSCLLRQYPQRKNLYNW